MNGVCLHAPYLLSRPMNDVGLQKKQDLQRGLILRAVLC